MPVGKLVESHFAVCWENTVQRILSLGNIY